MDNPEARFSPHTPAIDRGGVAQYFVEHPEVAWLMLVAVLILGAVSYSKLAQQEDPKIPDRQAMLVTYFPGASSDKIEELVTRKLEQKIAEQEALDEMSSQSRNGVSAIKISLLSANRTVMEQEWDKLRAKLKQVALPEGCLEPVLDTDFGNTVTLLYALTSPPISEPECVARAQLIRDGLRKLRGTEDGHGRAALFIFYPATVSKAYRANINRAFGTWLETLGMGRDLRLAEGEAYAIADFVALTNRAGLETALEGFARQKTGTDGETHPDVSRPVVLMDNEDPLPPIRALEMPRFSYRELEKAAELMEDEAKQIPSVGRVRKIGTVEETIYLLYSLAQVTGFQMSPDAVMRAINARNAIIPGGVLRTEGQNFPVQISGEYRDELAMQNTIVALSTNATGEAEPVYLRDVFEIRRGYQNPITFKVDVLHRDAPDRPLANRRVVLLAVEMKEGAIIGHFNDAMTAMVDQIKPRLPDKLEVIKVSDQPRAVRERISRFMTCFIEAVMIVIIVALFLMDWRAALVVATAIPLTVAMTLTGMYAMGIPLHQISISSLILALGMLVDDPVVASDGINRELAAGEPRHRAAWLGPYKLRRAILYATVINIVAFLPLVLLPGDKGAFIFALPAVVTMSLISSRVVSMTFIPLLGYYILRGQKGLDAGGELRHFILFRAVDRLVQALLPRYKVLLQTGMAHPWKAVGIAYSLLAVSCGLVPFFGTQFFPPAERNQFLIDVELPESASIVQTTHVTREIANILKHHSNIVSAAVFMGGTSPRFYYNVSPKEPGEFLAQFLVNTRSDRDVIRLLPILREELDASVASARCLVKQLEQGVPVEAPIQIRISGDNLDTLRVLGDQAAAVLRKHGAYKVHDDLGRRMPTLRINVDQERANILGVDNSLVGRLAQSAFTGLKVTELREGDHLIPVKVRLRPEDRNEADRIKTFYVQSMNGALVPLDNFSKLDLKPEYATIAHFNQLRTINVKAYSQFHELPSAVLDRATADLRAIPLPQGFKLEFAGEHKELRESQSEMGVVMLTSLGLIALAMVMQFNSVIKSIVVMLTVPLGLFGAFCGIAITQSALGFMALLGIVSLAGVIVSHIIVLSDFIEEARSEGMALKDALLQAGLVRLRAVIVTVLATVCGLIPLAVTGGELWKPLTAVHIFGLLFATVLTLVILPVLYYVFCAQLKLIK